MPVIFFIFVGIFGLLIGSFLNCLIWRLHTSESILGRSYCPSCKKQIAWYDNVPLLSYILLKGRCRLCGQAISWQYPMVELAGGVLFFLAAFLNYNSGIMDYGGDALNMVQDPIFLVRMFRDFFLISAFILIFIIDLRWFLIYDKVTLPACAVVFALNLILGMDWQNMVFSGIIGGGFFLSQYLISKGKWIGGGDIRLGLLMGLALGWPHIIPAIMIAYFLGAAVGVYLMAAGKKKMGSQLPLGVFLSSAAVIILFWGDEIIAWYLHKLLL